jgi:hypothetical protein
MLSLVTLAAAFGLAKRQEEYILITSHPLRTPCPSYFYCKKLPWTASAESSSVLSSLLRLQHLSLGIAIQKLSLAQMTKRRDKGLCYNFDEKWNPAHKCKSLKLFLMHGCDVFSEEKLDEVFCDDSMDGGDP